MSSYRSGRTSRPVRLHGSFLHRGNHRVNMSGVAALLGISRKALYDACQGIGSDELLADVADVVEQIERGEVVFQRRQQQWEVEWPPPVQPQPQPRLVRASDFVKWARCCSCGGHWYTAARLNGDRWMLCDGCLPVEQWPAIGAQPLKPK